MNSPKEEDILIINPSIHKTTKLSRKQFLDKVSFVKAIRTIENNTYLTIYPYDYNEYLLIEQFHDLINKGDFSFFQSSNKHEFGIIVPKALFSWFKNTDLVVIQKQIISWLTSIYVINDCDWRNKMREDLYSIVFEEVLSVFKNYYPENIDTITGYSDLKDVCRKACTSYAGSLPSQLLCDFYFPFYSPCEKERERLEKEWGLLDQDEKIHNFVFFFDSFYFTKTDWEDIVENDKENSLQRAESSSEIWHKWEQTFSHYETRKTHIFSFFSEEQKKGFIYVIRRGDTSEYKIGWTADHDINKRCKSLQTGSPEILTVRGHFPTSSQKTEKVIHNIFKKQHISGEWFYLTEDQVVNLLNPYWRQKNNIY